MSSITHESEVRDLRKAETILGIIRERGGCGLPLERVYRLLFNPGLKRSGFVRLG